MIGKFLAEGQLPTSEGALYTCPSGKVAYIKLITLGNATATTSTGNVLFRKGAGTNRLMYRFELAQNQSASFTGSFVLEAGDSLRGVASAFGTIDYAIFGVEETP